MTIHTVHFAYMIISACLAVRVCIAIENYVNHFVAYIELNVLLHPAIDLFTKLLFALMKVLVTNLPLNLPGSFPILFTPFKKKVVEQSLGIRL